MVTLTKKKNMNLKTSTIKRMMLEYVGALKRYCLLLKVGVLP
ncbi:Uncharacterised protein [Grimontia hollisae]|uniref:Uncharacterized protein n=1 Tax=Grimontia hollisae TaxID=673 RepID=A0A377HPX5_GRIHO|nr:Uncharacterised protein [Grimontia hollisae]